jgi:DNA-binding HxlR family transcriptional regulator
MSCKIRLYKLCLQVVTLIANSYKNVSIAQNQLVMKEDFSDIFSCPIEKTLKVVGGKWKPVIIYFISTDVRRFGELSRMITGISKRMLTANLRELEDDKIISRKVYAVVPPRVDYTLTDVGKSLMPVINLMYQWGESRRVVKPSV